MRCIAFLLFFIFSTLGNADLTPHELDMFDWSSTIRFGYCLDRPLPDLMIPFRKYMSKYINIYCKNSTACGLNYTVTWGPRDIAILDGFPKREAVAIVVKFSAVIPLNGLPNEKPERPLLKKQVLSDILKKYNDSLRDDLGWEILSYEKYPRFDAMTEFMNIAIIPIVIISLPLMICLAYWVSTLRPNSGSETWMVTGSAGGKNAALRRTMEIIAEQNEEYERQQRYALTKNVAVTSGHEGITTTGELLLNVARLSMASSQPTSVQSPQIFIQAGSSSSSSHPRTSIVSLSHGKELLHVKPKHSRRPSSVEEIKKARRLRGHRRSDAKQWKSGSLMLAGFRRT
ncbi:unnamed protein product [Caenorhabditis angaria]|uniref:DUF8077 domain-containing protein n=1 Tax=Caenorhabditis angaria TaxID=860376 RepID=A0A9P1J096_9PELO|nr:unnamed protein product [Caenorhabditis angaria]